MRSQYQAYNFLRNVFKRSLTYPCSRSLYESRAPIRIKHSYEEQALAYLMNCEVKKHRLAKMEYCYSGTENCDTEVQIITFVLKGSASLLIDSRSKLRSRTQIYCSLFVFDLNLSGIHLTQMILRVWIIDWHYIIYIDVSICEVELRC